MFVKFEKFIKSLILEVVLSGFPKSEIRASRLATEVCMDKGWLSLNSCRRGESRAGEELICR